VIRAVVARTLAVLLVAAAWSPRPVRADAVVGTGTPASCTESALNAALAGGGNVTFDCGPDSVTITVTSQKTIAVDTDIDGGSLITLSGGGATQVVWVNSGATLTLANPTIANGCLCRTTNGQLARSVTLATHVARKKLGFCRGSGG
jgi:hypothetical protein